MLLIHNKWLAISLLSHSQSHVFAISWFKELTEQQLRSILDLYYLYHCFPVLFHSNTSFKESHSFSFSRYHPSGVAAVAHSSKHNLLVVSGFDGDEPSLDKTGESVLPWCHIHRKFRRSMLADLCSYIR